ncbi:hypothetical protein KV337_003795 [Escherichia coli]|uniref:Insertion element IS1 protein InsA helix-turn-helix domain-containing protein n=4 Tax=Enterobacteriaceae TaxID=543 RepID=A0AAI9B7C8_ECOLX|nr:hypothetical protein [Salmonella enterica subsp. enterica serovar 4,[5],12:i:-]EAO4503124.1 hypothetical protein [Salmonella enterica]EAZ9754766.1 hypothetical protein [Salmonella enterica subsp. enterica serovar Typhimurium]ECI7398085.1 hypothetical protein [Salmonella enterica subsp. enterica]EDU0544726.1 hypothetical protein [Salmonella enterica subsp. enterica serovar Lagos]EFA4905929.1 hypothetical protein [Escherichia coli]EGO0901335.1 hypothetical protein [Salmonella enterica subsp.
MHLNPITGYWALSVHENTHKPGVKEQITEMAFNGAGVRDTEGLCRANKVVPFKWKRL